MKYTAKYKKGFTEGYNNPGQYLNLKIENLVGKPPKVIEFASGAIAGVIKRQQDVTNGSVNNFITDDATLKKKLEEAHPEKERARA